MERAGLACRLVDRLRQLGGAAAAERKVVAEGRAHAELLGDLADRRLLRRMVGWKCVDGDDWGHPMDLDVLDLLAQVRGARPDVVWVLLDHLRWQWPACHHPKASRMHLQRADGRDDDRRVGSEA